MWLKLTAFTNGEDQLECFFQNYKIAFNVQIAHTIWNKIFILLYDYHEYSES